MLHADALARVAVGATLCLPVALLYGRTLGEILIGTIAMTFLADRWLRWDWAWLRSGWAALSLSFWAWMVVCTLISGTPHSIAEAVAVVRLFLLTTALEHWVLRKPGARYLGWVVAAVAIWIAIQCWQQELTGTNFLGYARNSSGALTGPFLHPRAGAMFQQTFLPGLLPLLLVLLRRDGLGWRVLGMLGLLLGGATSLIISQRMPLALLVLGICIVALAIRRYRLPLLIGGACCAGLLLLSPLIAPEMYARLVTHFLDLMRHYMESPYGLLLNRAVAMVQAHPWTGFGFDGFRDHCMDPAFRNGSSWLPAADPDYALKAGWLLKTTANNRAGCSLHPHNYWLQMASSTGFVGLLLFAVLAGVTLRQIGRGAIAREATQQVCLFAATFVIFWPIASSTTLFALPNAGWVFLTIGWGLGEARGAAEAGG